MKLVSILSSFYNEQDSIEFLTERVRSFFAGLPQYRYEHILIDNQSNDRTVEILRRIADKHPNVTVVVDKPGIGTPRSAIAEASGDAAVILFCDLHDSPEMIRTFLNHWEANSSKSAEYPTIGVPSRPPAERVRSALASTNAWPN